MKAYKEIDLMLVKKEKTLKLKISQDKQVIAYNYKYNANADKKEDVSNVEAACWHYAFCLHHFNKGA